MFAAPVFMKALQAGQWNRTLSHAVAPLSCFVLENGHALEEGAAIRCKTRPIRTGLRHSGRPSTGQDKE